ncbi:glycoside hydrolase family 3 protein [Mycobacterium sp. 663a-19]|uniref:glycoside hydrolase family 3 N-terminal domain-containing protein n=1 Tax=Mycobacterium sp. 663a-19 TaxID=2986148 RepID=UPI002D1E9375|nr:glycoside hydrolase family 3 N-terminal domain-containing protein [Mycobacterium sp. 663a-19]MEB3981798.1 glycoside hydrolase family 3 protein [Mycobacterium sp. 663a-19]
MTDKRGLRSWPRAAIVAISILAVAVVAGGIAVGLRLGRTQHAASSPPPGKGVSSPAPPGCDISSLLASMSPRDKLAQLLMVGVTDAADARAVVSGQHVGGIFVASWTNMSMLSDGSLAEIASSAGPLHLGVSVDEEGGRVERLSAPALLGTAPSARFLAQNESPEQVYRLALDRGRKMRRLGITIDFAPVVDVTDAPDDTVIGDRSFSDKPAVVTQYAGAYARGLRDAGILPVLKHFPGHGHASGDSHATGVVTPPLAEMQGVDLVPYRTLVDQAPVGVMIGHMQVPDLTGDDPASLSKAAVTLLRNGKDYGAPRFEGPVFTDDLSSMRAITDRYGISDAVLKALQAGADTALWVSTTAVPAVLDRLVSALASGELSMPAVEASVRRMAAAKAFDSPCGR